MYIILYYSAIYYSILYYIILWCVALYVCRFVSGAVAAALDILSRDYFKQKGPFGDSTISHDFPKILGKSWATYRRLGGSIPNIIAAKNSPFWASLRPSPRSA